VACWFGLAASLLTAHTGHQSGRDIAQYQPMKLAAAEGLYEGGQSQGLVLAGVLRPGVDWSSPTDKDRFLLNIEMPYALSILATHEADGYVPGIRNLLEGGYKLPDGSTALSAEEKMQRGRTAIAALADYRAATDPAAKEAALKTLRANFDCFGYGYLKSPSDLVPPVPLTFYSFRIMVILGGYFIALFAGMLLLGKWVSRHKLLLLAVVLTTPLAWVASQAGWIVAEVGRQPWSIQDLLPNVAAISRLEVGAVQTTFMIFAVLFTLLLVAEISIMAKAIATGPETDKTLA
jgi:cytochrome d ubiquinol oxidase subunit I